MASKTVIRRILVTGVAGFIGSHIADRLLDLGLEVVGVDNLSSGIRQNLARAISNKNFQFIHGDLIDPSIASQVLGDCNLVYHLAADPEVRSGAENPESHFKQNLLVTFNLLEALRKRKTPTRLVFASTSTVYGEPLVIPTPETYGPLLPISTYGATKLGCEALISSYTELLPLQAVIFRFANVVGPRSGHGVIPDFVKKLRTDPNELEILGDGTQSKSYLYVDDCVEAFLTAQDETMWQGATSVYNVGSEQQTGVLRIARIVAEAMNLTNVRFKTSQPQGVRAWPGDVKTMLLDVAKLKKQGWNPKLTSDEAVQLASRHLAQKSE